MAEKKDRKTKRKINLVSSHSDNERDEGHLALIVLKAPQCQTYTEMMAHLKFDFVIPHAEQYLAPLL